MSKHRNIHNGIHKSIVPDIYNYHQLYGVGMNLIQFFLSRSALRIYPTLWFLNHHQKLDNYRIVCSILQKKSQQNKAIKKYISMSKENSFSCKISSKNWLKKCFYDFNFLPQTKHPHSLRLKFFWRQNKAIKIRYHNNSKVLKTWHILQKNATGIRCRFIGDTCNFKDLLF